MLEAVHVAAHELGAEGLVRGEGNALREAQEVRPDALDMTLRIDGPRRRCEDRGRRGGPKAADRAAHHIGGDQPGQGEKVMPRETLSGIVAVEVEEEGPDRPHVEAGELCKGLGERRIGFLAEHHGAVMIGAERLGTRVVDPPRAGMGLEGRVFPPCFGTSPVLSVRKWRMNTSKCSSPWRSKPRSMGRRWSA